MKIFYILDGQHPAPATREGGGGGSLESRAQPLWKHTVGPVGHGEIQSATIECRLSQKRMLRYARDTQSLGGIFGFHHFSA